MIEFERAKAFAEVALANVTRPYPRKLDHLLDAPHGDLTPEQMHPAFYGSYDWHSAVHMHWLLVRLLRMQPRLPQADRIAEVLDAHLSPACLSVEQAYFEGRGRRTFERPYGWAWSLELQAEALRLSQSNKNARRWAEALQPFADYLAKRMREFVSVAAYPIRNGMHSNTAFACVLALDYARIARDSELAEAICQAAQKWYFADCDAPLAYEPSLADFLSPTLSEAQLMREVLSAKEFRRWLKGFLPSGLGPLATPPVVSDRADAQMVHLDGLTLSRAWSLRRLSGALPGADAAADIHLGAGLPEAAGGDYVGEHWLASFAALALGEMP